MLLIIKPRNCADDYFDKTIALANDLCTPESLCFFSDKKKVAFYRTNTLESLNSKSGVFNGYASIDGIHHSADPEAGFLDKCLGMWRSKGVGFLEKLNGSFNIVLYDNTAKKLLISTDRFNTYPLWQAKLDSGIRLISESYHFLVPFVSKELDYASLWSFMARKRAIANRTLLKQITALREHVALCLGDDSNPEEISWINPKYESHDEIPLKEWARIFNNNIDNVIDTQLKYFKNPALLLSGGIDSRIIASVSPKRTKCFTVADFFNTEMKMAVKTANTCGLQHIPIVRDENWYADIIKEASHNCHGLWNWVDSHFLPLGQHLENVDCVFSGLWFDTFMKGYESRKLYLENHAKILAPEKRLEYLLNYDEKQTKAGLFEKFMNKNFINDCKKEYRKVLKSEIERHLPLSNHIEEVWEMTQISSIYRVPSFPNIISIRKLKPSRTIIFDNKFFDMYFNMPIHYRCMGDVIRCALWQRNKKLARQLNSNSWLPMFLPTKYHDQVSKFRGTGSRVRNKIYRMTKSNEYRSMGSWPQMGRLWAHNKAMKSIMNETLKNPNELLQVFDIDSLKKIWQGHQSGEGDYNDILNIIVNLNFSGVYS